MLYPEYYVDSVKDVDYEALREKGVKVLLFDVDNTLETYVTPLPGSAARELVQRLKDMGFRIVLVSNGREQRVARYAAVLDVHYIFRAKKPLPSGFRRALAREGVKAGEAAVIGDQIFTDVWGGNWVGAHTVLVRPISLEVDEKITRIKRGMERRVIARYLKKRGIQQ